jgi:hypothetical protein
MNESESTTDPWRLQMAALNSAVSVLERDGHDPAVDPSRGGMKQMLRSASGTPVLQGFSNGAGLLTALLLARFLGRLSELPGLGYLDRRPSASLSRCFLVSFPSIFRIGFPSGVCRTVSIIALSQLNAAAGSAGKVLVMTGYEIAAVWAVGVGALVNLVLAILLVPPFGVTGGAIAFALSLVLWNVALVVIARRRLGINVTAFRSLSVANSKIIP